ncbi:MAG: hypothetical protein U5L10_00190 [Candidatus Moranbacteria bacterium]|nr:hypothetical protein [Candidatus Moranbacteria bacterium]
MRKKILIISISLFFLAGAAYGIKNFFLDKQGGKLEVTNKEKDREETKENSSFSVLVEGDVKSAAFNRDKDVIFYYNKNNFLSLSLEGLYKKNAGSYPLKKPEEIEWSFNRNKVMVKQDNRISAFKLFDNESTELKKGIREAVWNTFGDGIIYHYADKAGQVSEIDISSTNGENWKKIIDTPFENVELKLRPGNKEVLYYPSGQNSNDTENGVYLVDLVEKEREKIFDLKKNFSCQWSPEGEYLLISFQQADKAELGYLDIESGEYYSLAFPTVAEKCVWGDKGEFVYCGLITGFSEDVNLIENWKEERFFSNDTFWRIDTEAGKKDRLTDLQKEKNSVDAVNLLFNEKQGKLYFIDRKSGNLMSAEVDIKEK